ncbi:mechanosensitive ion channel family protein [bacterium]|nr:MAG: mechanosensitive ion channel family protein [bacterium]
MMNFQSLQELLETWGMSASWSPAIASAIALIILVIVALIVDLISRRILLNIFIAIARRSSASWDDELVENEVLHQLAHLPPTMLVYSALPIVLVGWTGWIVDLLQHAALVYLVIVVVIAIYRTLNAALAVYNRTQVSSRVPLRPVVQLLQGILIFAAVVMVVAMLINKSAAALLGGFGAFAAVLMLVFQQPLLGLAAGIQLSANRMVRRGDWISVPKFGADGTVTQISLTTVSVQNWDKTISSVPTHALMTDTFRNWRGMEESGGRRVKRAILIDLNTIRFMDDKLRERMNRLQFLREHLTQREEEVARFNRENQVDESSPANGRRLTNIGSFRAYLEHYLHAHEQVSDSMTFLVRQLDPTPQGLPIEIYVFLTEQRWAEYEAIQADIFDHILAVVPEFGLRAFQQPGGQDLAALSSTLRSS